MNAKQSEKARHFYKLHESRGVFLIPNPWDAGAARILTGLGFEAFATSSSACAAVLGRRDHSISRGEAISHIRVISGATDRPVSADLENGFGDDPATVAETIQMAADAGAVGGSIEDAPSDKNKPLYDINHAADRITAAVEAARSLPFRFTLTARAENFVHSKPDLEDTINRLLSYQKAGADVLFAPALPDLAAVRAVCSAVSRPVNFMVGVSGKSFTVAELAEAGVKRISFASSLYRAAMTRLVDVASEVKRSGTFAYLDQVNPDLNIYLQQ
jgi:2-methylisocitrate lyase-like PEP mutase family enzyme